jgi:hypothetical protein
MGVVLWYRVEFPDLHIAISSDVYSGDYLDDAAISVSYGIGQPGSFEIRFKNLALNVRAALADALGSTTAADGGVAVVISLGYLDDRSTGNEAVLTGRVDNLQATARFPPLGALLTGYETASYSLLNTPRFNGGTEASLARVAATDSDELARIVGNILQGAGVQPDPDGKVTFVGPQRGFNADAENAFNLLDAVAAKFQAEILVQEGKVQFGTAVTFPAKSGIPKPPNIPALLALLTGEDSLIAVEKMDAARLAEFKPFQLGRTSKQRIVTDLPKGAEAFDFTALGVPTMRAGELVVVSVDGFDNPTDPFRILQLTHSFSPDSGYVCSGRAVRFHPGGGNRVLSEKARRGSPVAIADRLAGKIRDAGIVSPSVDVGKVKATRAADRLATLFYAQERTGGQGSPSVDIDVPEGESVLLNKPLVSPFAWHRVGLSVPVYEGMRALLNEVRDLRDDSVVTGFLWANTPKMDRPKSRDGDWWLCLPTEVSGNPPVPQGKGANDLTAADGRRVMEVAGLKIVVGKDGCSAVGERPAEGDADVFVISHKSGTTIQVDASGNVSVDGKGQTVVLKCDGVNLTVGDGKVSIS